MNHLKDCFSGLSVEKNYSRFDIDRYVYFHKAVGNVDISREAYITIQSKDLEKIRYIYGGLCRNRFEEGLSAPLILLRHLTEDAISEINYPKSFREKKDHLIKFLFKKEDEEYEQIELHSDMDCFLLYAFEYEFIKVVESLWKDDLIRIGEKQSYPKMKFVYKDVRLSKTAIQDFQELSNSNTIEKIRLLIAQHQKDEIRELISEYKTESALNLIKPILKNHRYGAELVTMIELDLNRLAKENISGLISQSDYVVKENTIIKRILDLI